MSNEKLDKGQPLQPLQPLQSVETTESTESIESNPSISTYTIQDLIDSLEQDDWTNESETTFCTYPSATTQLVFVCRTCYGTSNIGLCEGCADSCHSNDTCHIEELGLRHNFVCDCGTDRDPLTTTRGGCKLTNKSTNHNLEIRPSQSLNQYGQNFQGLYCYCHQGAQDVPESETMIQCTLCCDWFHDCHIDAVGMTRSTSVDELESKWYFCCRNCLKDPTWSFLQPYIFNELNESMNQSNMNINQMNQINLQSRKRKLQIGSENNIHENRMNTGNDMNDTEKDDLKENSQDYWICRSCGYMNPTEVTITACKGCEATHVPCSLPTQRLHVLTPKDPCTSPHLNRQPILVDTFIRRGISASFCKCTRCVYKRHIELGVKWFEEEDKLEEDDNKNDNEHVNNNGIESMDQRQQGSSFPVSLLPASSDQLNQYDENTFYVWTRVKLWHTKIIEQLKTLAESGVQEITKEMIETIAERARQDSKYETEVQTNDLHDISRDCRED
ncbi:MAG: ubiquitin protein ligase E3 component n-recognin 7 [Sylvanvirus sp.]|uniref:Ubiquitin protein ligase E3 component n-recognin 7 n=1 Tax=Sylvanvirus sp. TaxID=2487774 RepID=A0A3G5AIA5_9VIRU|nr:MAG: ubiquitin protein ligase E3 component n-recognin 7 [Sylvanvirus sp.]